MIWFRIDNRLVHGQVIEAWLPYLHVRTLVVVNDELEADMVRQQIMRLAVPARVTVFFVNVVNAVRMYDEAAGNDKATLFLLANCTDVMRLADYESVAIPSLNIGNMHYGVGKQHVCAHVALSEEEKACLKRLEESGTELDFRCVPDDLPEISGW